MTNLLEGLVSTPTHKAKALDLLSGLVDTPPRRKVTPLWKADALIVLSRETTCSHCSHGHLEINPLLLLREISPTGAIRETSSPNSVLHTIKELPIEYQTIPAGSVPFCLECIEEPLLDLPALFMKQRASGVKHTAPRKETGFPVTETLADSKLAADIQNLENHIANLEKLGE